MTTYTETGGSTRRKTRWAAAATGMTLLIGSVVSGAVATPGQISALPGASESTVVAVDPTRVLDTRFSVGLTGAVVASTNHKLQVTGPIPTYVEATGVTTTKTVVPAGATGVLMNITAINPTAGGFLSVRPGDAAGVPSTAGLNFTPGDIVPNALTIAVPTTGSDAGTIDLYYGTVTAGSTVQVAIDIIGYTTNTGLSDLANRLLALEASGVKGDKGDKGDTGDPGTDGAPAVDPANVVWVAESGDNTFPLLSEALTSITDNSSTTPYVIKIAPGTYTETSEVAMKDFVDIEGSGQDVTTITCACAGASFPSPVLSAGNITAEVRHVTITNANNGAATRSTGISTKNVTPGSLSLLHVTATATGGTNNTGVFNEDSSPTMTNVTATATGGTNNTGVVNSSFSGSSPTMTNVTATATGGTNNTGVALFTSSTTMTNVTATATGGTNTNTGLLFNNPLSSTTLTNVTATATGGTTTAYGVHVDGVGSGSPTLINLTATASGATNSYGMFNDGASMSIRNSAIIGIGISIVSGGAAPTMKVANTMLVGSVAGSGFACVGAHDGAFVLLSTVCD